MTSLKERYQENFLAYEFGISVIISLIVIAIIQIYWSKPELYNWINSNKSGLYSLLASISGTLLGFIITGISVILAFSESQKLRRLKESTQYKTIFVVYFNTIKYLAFTTIVAILGFVVNNRSVDFYLLYVLIWLLIISSLRIWRCLWILEELVTIMTKIN
jgi:hypothetical protein